MGLETFTWPIQLQDSPEGTFEQRVRKAQFGDGYVQISGDGVNSETQTWPVTYTATDDLALAMLNFLRRHGSHKSFVWTPPKGVKGLYIATEIRVLPISSSISKVSATFTQSFHP